LRIDNLNKQLSQSTADGLWPC